MNDWNMFLIVALCLILMFGGMLYLAVPFMSRGAFCPSATFIWGRMGSSFYFFLGFVAGIFSLVFLIPHVARGSNGTSSFKSATLDELSKNFRITYTVTMIAGLTFSIAMWVVFSESYFCVTPDTILVHDSAFRAARSSTWDDVLVVRAECWPAGKGRAAGGLALELKNGDEIRLDLDSTRNSGQRNYRAVREALKYTSYFFKIDPSVTAKACPRALHQDFMEWVQNQ